MAPRLPQLQQAKWLHFRLDDILVRSPLSLCEPYLAGILRSTFSSYPKSTSYSNSPQAVTARWMTY